MGTEGVKFDDGKLRYDLIPASAALIIDGLRHESYALLRWHHEQMSHYWLTGNVINSIIRRFPERISWPEALAKVLTFGARKYGDHNWRKGMAWSRLVAAALRHLNAPEENDPESGYPHVWHALCCCIMLLEYQMQGIGTDDRYSAPEA